MIKRILVPIDGSVRAEGVLPYVSDLAERLSAQLHFLQVIPLDPSLLVAASAGRAYSGKLLRAELESEVAAAEVTLARLAVVCRDQGINATWEVAHGEAASCIAESAQRLGSDLIAMSTRGREGVTRLVLGSVTGRVVRTAAVPMLLVGPGLAGSAGSTVEPCSRHRGRGNVCAQARDTPC